MWHNFQHAQAGLTTPTWNNYVSCSFYGSLTIQKTSTAYLSSFVRYCSLKNSPLCLVEMFLDYNSRSRFFQDVRFLQKVRVPIGLSYSSKKRTYERNRLFAKTQRTSFRGHFLGFFYTLLTQRDFFQKQGSVTFLTLCHLTLCKIRKT